MNKTLLNNVLLQLATLRHDDDDHDHDHEHGTEGSLDPNDLDKTKVNIAKGTAMLCLFTASTLCGSIPFLLNRWFKWTENNANARSATVVKCMLYFGGGVLLCTTFLHLLPEVKEAIEHLQEEHRMPHLNFHFAELLMCIGFFTMFLVEELIHAYIHNHQKTFNDNSAQAAFERGHSVRNSYLIRSSIKKKSSNANDTSSLEITQPSSSVISVKSDSTKQPSNLNNVPNGYNNTSNDNNDTIMGNVNTTSKSNQNNNNNSYDKNMQISSITSPSDIESQQLKGFVEDRGLNNKNDNKYDEVDHFHHKLHHSEGSTHYNHHHNHHNAQHSHGHCHLPPGDGNFDEDMIVSSLRGLLVVLALSIHELFEGLAVGLEQSASKVWLLFGAVSAHKLVLAFCVGVELIVTRTRLWLAICYVITFAIVSPIGIGIGILVSNQDSNASDIPSAILQGLATGTLLYVVFFEILSKDKSGILAWGAFVIGFFVMFGLQLATGHNHSHSHGGGGHEHNHDDHDHLSDEHAQKLIEDKLRVFREIANEFTQTLPRKINK